MRWLALLALAVCLPAAAQEERRLESDGETIVYTLRKPAPDAHLADPASKLAPTSALDTARLVVQYLARGDIEEAAMLSNSPRERFERYKERLEMWGEEQFKRLFGEYALPENTVVAEIAIGEHSLLIWNLAKQKQLAGQFFVRIEDRVLMDDTLNPTREQLRRVLQAYRSGAAAN
jgi:hypothetical protein